VITVTVVAIQEFAARMSRELQQAFVSEGVLLV
jgi:hypothetical protein